MTDATASNKNTVVANDEDEFAFVERYDDTANTGRWCHINDENGNSHGEFLAALFDETTNHFRVATEEMAAKYKTVKKGEIHPDFKGLTDDQLKLRAFVEISLLDWRGIKNPKGKDVPFSKEAAYRYLNHPKGLYAMKGVLQFATDIKNYQPEDQTELPEGN